MSVLTTRWLGRTNDPSIAIRDGEGDHSYERVIEGSLRVAAALRGGRASLDGERVAILIGPSAGFVSAFFGVLLAGGCVVVLSPLHPAPETRYFCDDAAVRTILFSEEQAALIAPLAAFFDARPLEPILQSTAGSPAPASRADTDAALQLYTSGTTGKPKGAVITHANLATQQGLLGEAWGFSARDTLLHALPLHHMHGLVIALLTSLGAGATTWLTTFDAKQLWEKMGSATAFMAVPAMVHRLFLAFDAADDATRARWAANAKQLRLATSGSAALPVQLAERWRAITGTIPLERFGMTEVGVGLTNRLEGERYPGCVGFPLPSVETRIIGDDGKDGEMGELWIRGPSVFAEYHRRPEETKKAFAEDGWFKTGDTVTREASGAFKILGRTSVDILKSGGYKLSALEIEEVLRDHPSVAEVAVIGVPDEAWGDRVVACVVAKADVAQDADAANAIRAFAKTRLAGYKVPKNVEFLAELPKNALGKVIKPELMARIRR